MKLKLSNNETKQHWWLRRIFGYFFFCLFLALISCSLSRSLTHTHTQPLSQFPRLALIVSLSYSVRRTFISLQRVNQAPPQPVRWIQFWLVPREFDTVFEPYINVCLWALSLLCDIGWITTDMQWSQLKSTHTPTEISRANKNNKAAKKEKGGNIFMWKRLLHCRSVVIHRLSIFYGWLGTGAIVFITFQMAISERVSIYCFVYLLAFFLFYQENATNYKEFMCSSPLSNVAIHFASAVYLSRGFFFCHMLADVKQNKILSQFTALYILH